MAKIKQHTVGEVRYFTYYLQFPDGETWVDQSPFVGNLLDIIKSTRFFKIPEAARNLTLKGEHSYKDHNGVNHFIKVEEEKRPRKWGTRTRRS